MRILDKARLRLRSLCRRRNVDFELEAELRFHLDQLIEEKISSGMPPEEARRAARRMIEGVIEHISRRRTMCQLMMQNVKRAVLLGLGVLAAGISGMAGVPSGFDSTPIFAEEFNENSLNTTIWTYRA
jgi:hypothetical protein